MEDFEPEFSSFFSTFYINKLLNLRFSLIDDCYFWTSLIRIATCLLEIRTDLGGLLGYWQPLSCSVYRSLNSFSEEKYNWEVELCCASGTFSKQADLRKIESLRSCSMMTGRKTRYRCKKKWPFWAILQTGCFSSKLSPVPTIWCTYIRGLKDLGSDLFGTLHSIWSSLSMTWSRSRFLLHVLLSAKLGFLDSRVHLLGEA